MNRSHRFCLFVLVALILCAPLVAFAAPASIACTGGGSLGVDSWLVDFDQNLLSDGKILIPEQIDCEKNKIVFSYGTPRNESVITIGLAPEKRKENADFKGLAAYYNESRFMFLSNQQVSPLEHTEPLHLQENDWIVIVDRFDSQLIRAPKATVKMVNDVMTFTFPENTSVAMEVVSGSKNEVVASNDLFAPIRYSHLFPLLASLAKAVEWAIVQIQTNFVPSWGWSLVIFAVLVKLCLLPVSFMTVSFQRQVSKFQAILTPKLVEIKANYKGEQAHEKIMEAHKDLGITPFYTLKPILGSFIQIPVLIGIFNALGEMPQFDQASFLWIKNLAYPDMIFPLSFSIPLLGDKVSLLPFVMTAVSILATVFFTNRHAPVEDIRKQKRNLYLMAAAFFVLFYPFPAVMVLYWTLANSLQMVQQKFLKI